MSSHREAPEISKDPVADNTDVYAFVSPDRPSTVTLIVNYIPLEEPAAARTFTSSATMSFTRCDIDNVVRGPVGHHLSVPLQLPVCRQPGNTFLYNTGPIRSLSSPNWNSRQFYTVTRVAGGLSQPLGTGLACPPCNIGPLSTPRYRTLAESAVHSLPGGVRVFAGQRAEGFYVDLGSIFDLATLRPFQQLHAKYGMHVFSKPEPGVNATNELNVHSIALQVPIAALTGSSSRDESDPRAVIGVWTTATGGPPRCGTSSGG